jgi:MFS family permease
MMMSDSLKPYFMWCLPLCFFAFQFILRLWPGLNMQYLFTQFSIDASDFGLFAAFYYYGYAGMQIPLAILLERFDVAKVTSCCALLCGVAMLMLTQTHNFYLAVACRFFIGVGSAVGFLATSKILMQWFSVERYAKMVGLSFSFGLLGAIYGGKPISLLINQFSPQTVAFGLAMVAFMLSAMIFLFLRPPQKSISEEHSPLTLASLYQLVQSTKLWTLALANLLMVGALEGFADVWGVSYLVKAYHLTKSDAAFLCSFIFVGMLFGGPLLASLSKRFGNYWVLISSGLGLATAFFLILSNVLPHQWQLLSILFVVGLLCCYQVIVFATGTKLVPAHQQGLCVAFLNCINMLGGSFFHTLIGYAMNVFWQGSVAADGVKLYSLYAYQHALMIIPLCALVGMVCLISQQRAFKGQALLQARTC